MDTRMQGTSIRFGDVDVIHVDLRPSAEREARAMAWLDEAERARLRRFVVQRPRRQYALCRAALRRILCRRLGCENALLSLPADQLGKPFACVRGSPVQISFSISHSGSHGLVACARYGSLGVDVEEYTSRNNMDAIAGIACSAAEQAAMASVTGPAKREMFYRLWTMKEALAKATGLGMTADLPSLEIPEDLRFGNKTSLVCRLDSMPRVSWRLDNIGCAEYAAALAHESSEPRSQRRR